MSRVTCTEKYHISECRLKETAAIISMFRERTMDRHHSQKDANCRVSQFTRFHLKESQESAHSKDLDEVRRTENEISEIN